MNEELRLVLAYSQSLRNLGWGWDMSNMCEAALSQAQRLIEADRYAHPGSYEPGAEKDKG